MLKVSDLTPWKLTVEITTILTHCLTKQQSPLSGEDIWIKVLTQKRSIVHMDVCDLWNDLRPFLKYLAQPFSSKLRSKEAKGLKSENLGKQTFFLNIKFLLDSILILCTMVNFHLQVG